jgi:hypothetical protein
MARAPRFHGLDLTHHHQAPKMFAGYSGAIWFKLYGFFAVMAFILCYVYTRYFELFDDIESQPAGYKLFVLAFAGLPVLLIVPAVGGFFWWAAGRLVEFSRWQRAAPLQWRWYWTAVMVFYSWVLVDPLDSIWPAISRKGLFPAFDFYYLFDHSLDKFYMFQWGVFLLWLVFWCLIVALVWVHATDGLAKFWFYTSRTQRYAVSVLTGLRETARVQLRQPVTLDYPRERPQLPPSFRGVPRLNVEELTLLDTRAILNADASGAITAAPGQPTVLFIDLGRYDYSPELAELRNTQGEPLLRFTDFWASPSAGREDFIIPLKPRPGESALPAGEAKWIK